MNFIAHIDVMPLTELLDPQGKAVMTSLHSLKMEAVSDVRIGKHIKLWIEASDKDAAQVIAEEACRRMLCNPVMETFRIELE